MSRFAEEGLGYYAPAATNPMTFLDRDPAGFVVAAHWSGGHSDWQPSNPYHQICNTQALSGYEFFEPSSDGISDGENTIQGVRNFDPALATWTSPDEYAGDASDPMSRKSYMWNRNNSYAYSDPTGYCSISSSTACAETTAEDTAAAQASATYHDVAQKTHTEWGGRIVCTADYKSCIATLSPDSGNHRVNPDGIIGGEVDVDKASVPKGYHTVAGWHVHWRGRMWMQNNLVEQIISGQ